MDKMKMHTPNKADENFEKLAQMFPNAVTETIDDTTGEVVRAIDKDVLMQEINTHVVEGREERYQFTWPDKKKSILLANAPINKTLRPCREESVDFDNTENLYIEGDNLEVLKLLQETYLGKIKMIYIDPPYNTGNDFVYEDNFAQSTDEYMENSGQFDEEGNRLVKNLDSNGRFHTDWLNMIYPRLKLAKDLLADDGVIFISIDDNEQENLKKLCDEIFGITNFVAQFVWNTEGHTDNQFAVKINHEYIITYAKNIKLFSAGYVIDPNTRKESNLWKGYAENSITKNGEANPTSEITLPVGFPCKISSGRIKNNMQCKEFFDEVKKQHFISRSITQKYNASYPIRYNDMIVEKHALVKPCVVFSGWANANKLRQFINNNCNPIIEPNGDEYTFYLSEKGVIYYNKKRTASRNILSVLRNMGTTEAMRYELEEDKIFFSYPKPNKLIQYLIKIGNVSENQILLDFFSGSATAAHAVMQLNAEDGGNRKFIMIQLPELTDEKSEAYKAGYKNICEIGKERIRRAGAKIKEQNDKLKDTIYLKNDDDINLFTKAANKGIKEVDKIQDSFSKIDESRNLDLGFRVLKCDSSNMKDVYYNPSDYTASLFDTLEDNIKDDRTPEDLLFQVMLDLGVLLSSKIEETIIGDKKVFNVSDNYLIACFDSNVTDETITEIAKKKPYYFVMRDSSMANDSVATNFEQIFATYSPDTIRKVL